jgi:hypothetical protein
VNEPSFIKNNSYSSNFFAEKRMTLHSPKNTMITASKGARTIEQDEKSPVAPKSCVAIKSRITADNYLIS